jgi:putative tricarboxylic transport membrane protein
MAGLLSGEISALSTGFSEAVAMAKAGKANIIGVTSNQRVDALKDAKTMKEQGINTYFVNWRGFFAAPNLPKDKLKAYQSVISKMYDTKEWEAVRSRNGWENIHNSGDKFLSFLEKQEKEMATLMKKLGFL